MAKADRATEAELVAEYRRKKGRFEKMIRTDEDAADLVRGLNKHSGGWASLETRGVPHGRKRTETWSALLIRSITGVVVPFARKRGGKRIMGRDLPPHVRQYLSCTDDRFPYKADITQQEWEGMAPNDSGLLRVRARATNSITKRVTFTVEYQPTRTVRGIAVGCEVGDSGEGPSDFLPFPVSEKAVVKAIEDAISYGRDLEYETGWAAEDA